MTSTDPTDDAAAALRRLRAATQPDAAATALAKLRAAPKPAGHDYHAEFKSGALDTRMQSANARDVANAAENTEEVGLLPAAGHALAATMANMGEGIPGFEAGQAGLRSVIRQQPYREALGDLRHETDQLPTGLKTVERIAGAAPLIKFLPANPVAGGAILGGLDQALAADADRSPLERALRTAGGAGGGALAGKIGETVVTGARTMAATSAATNIIKRLAAQAASAKRLYGMALKEGQGRMGTAVIQRFLKQPDIAEITGELQQTRPFQNTPAESPEMLDAIYKTLSDRAAQTKRGLESVTPNRPNVGRFRAKDIKMAQGELLDAVSGSASMPGPMPTMRTAVADFAQQAKGIEGVKKGYDAMRTATSPTLPTAKNLTRTTPESLQEWARAADDAAKSAAGEGTLGGAKSAWRGLLGGKMGRAAVSRAPKVLRDLGEPKQQQIDQWLTRLLLSGTAATP